MSMLALTPAIVALNPGPLYARVPCVGGVKVADSVEYHTFIPNKSSRNVIPSGFSGASILTTKELIPEVINALIYMYS